MPDLEALSKRFADQGLVILAISDEELIRSSRSLPADITIHPARPWPKGERTVSSRRHPKSFVYDREGKLVAQSIDMRTSGSFWRCWRRRSCGEAGSGDSD